MGAFDSLFCPEGKVSVHSDCPGRRFLPPLSRVPGRGGGKGWFWMKLIAALFYKKVVHRHFKNQFLKCRIPMWKYFDIV